MKKIYISMIIIITIFSLFKLREAEANRRSPNLNNALKYEELPSWRTKINGRYFDVFVDRIKKTVTIKGVVSDLEEMETIKRHLSLRAPSNYKIIHKIDFDNSINNESNFAD